MTDKKKDKPESSDAALKARLAQLELENRMRLQKQQPTQGGNPIKDTPRRGFGSAQGIAHLRHTEYQRRGPNPPPAPAPVPEPGKARFGGTYLRTPLPGIISADATPGFELIEPVPATPTAGPPQPPAKDAARAKPPGPAGGAPPGRSPAQPFAAPPPAAAKGPPPSGAMPSGRPLPGTQPPSLPAKEVAQAKPGPAIPPDAAFDAGKRRIVGGGAVAKAPLPALYHAGMKAAEAAEKAKMAATPPGAAPPPAEAKPAAEIQVPEGAEVTKDGPKPAPRVKRFKNPTLAPKEP